MKNSARNEKKSLDDEFYPRLEVPKRRIPKFQETVFIGKNLYVNNRKFGIFDWISPDFSAWNDTFDKIFWVLVAPIFVFLRLNEIRMMTETDWKRKEILILTKLKTFFCSATYGMVFNRWFAKCTLSFCILEKSTLDSTRLTGEIAQ